MSESQIETAFVDLGDARVEQPKRIVYYEIYHNGNYLHYDVSECDVLLLMPDENNTLKTCKDGQIVYLEPIERKE